MKIRFSPRARRRVNVVDTWWRENRRGAPTLFADELAEAIERLKVQPTLGTEYEQVAGSVIRRVLLPKSAQHLYYAVDLENDVIVIHTIWGARRGRGPQLD